MSMRRFLPLLVLLLLAAPASANGADSHAPHGARLDWLPTDTWVMSGWLPYDESDSTSSPTPRGSSAASG